MLYVYYGTDRGGVRDAASGFVEQHLLPDMTQTIIDASNYAPGVVADALGASSLFGGSECFLIDTPADNADLAQEVTDNLAAMAESGNTFIILEGALLAPAKKSYAKHATAEPQEFTATKAERFNTFAMADALASRDRRQLWVLLQEAKLNGLAAEEIIGMLWWQLKALRLAQVTGSASEAGMKDFPYNKAKRALSAFRDGEVMQLSHSLLTLYHNGHAGMCDIDVALERWVLAGK